MHRHINPAKIDVYIFLFKINSHMGILILLYSYINNCHTSTVPTVYIFLSVASYCATVVPGIDLKHQMFEIKIFGLIQKELFIIIFTSSRLQSTHLLLTPDRLS